MQKYISEARLLLALAIPVILAQIAQTAMGFVDTVMAGGYSATDMAAVAIGTSIWLPEPWRLDRSGDRGAKTRKGF